MKTQMSHWYYNMAATAVEKPTLERIQNFFNDTSYLEIARSTARFNVRIRRDRIYRQPYIDGQTGIAQKHCHLFVSNKERMPGILQGQVYTYPARRWKATHRPYLASMAQLQNSIPEPDEHIITTIENPVVVVPPVVPIEEPQSIEKPKMMMNNMEPWGFYEENTYEDEMEDEFESEEDYQDETYNKKSGNSRRRRLVPRRNKAVKTKRRVINKTPSKLIRNIKKDENDDKPYTCELCGMRYKTRPGLTYHYSHSHKEENDDTKSKPIDGMVNDAPVYIPPVSNPTDIQMNSWPDNNGLADRPQRFGDPSTPPMSENINAAPAPMVIPPVISDMQIKKEDMPPVKKSVPPSPYCDFCLGDAMINKKTGIAEKLVSCADCGRSGHPTCLQFTDNMVKSVVRYRWQCIECKTCTLCGTSENDDQLLFCDDCDRGYHLYCLSPPLSAPPEGEWSCYLCLREFHNK